MGRVQQHPAVRVVPPAGPQRHLLVERDVDRPEPGYREMLRITRMDQVFEVYDDERAALGSAW
jgi:hypothetical protein